MNVYLVSHMQIPEIWGKVEPLIKAACKYNNERYESADYLDSFISGNKQLWIALDGELKGLAVTELISFPRKRCCVIDIFTGEGLEELLRFLPLIETWAKENGCDQMLVATRIGLSKKLKSHNYHLTHTLLEKDL